MALLRGVVFGQRLASQFTGRDTLEDMVVHGMTPDVNGRSGSGKDFIILRREDPHFALLQAIVADASGGRYVVGPSRLPVTDPSLHVIDGRPVIMLEPEEAKQVLEPDVPSHILDHMYAKRYKEPGRTAPPKPRKRVRKRASVIAAEQRKEATSTSPKISTEFFISECTKVNIIRKNVSTSKSSSGTRCGILRPKILQNPKRITGIQLGGNEINKTSSSGECSNCDETDSAPSTHSSVSCQQQLVNPLPISGNSDQSLRTGVLTSSSSRSDSLNVRPVNEDENENPRDRMKEMCIMFPPDDYISLTGAGNDDGTKTDASLMQLTIPNESDVLGEVSVFSLTSMEDLASFSSNSQIESQPARSMAH